MTQDLKIQIGNVVCEMSKAAALSEEFAVDFTERITNDERLTDEFITYLKTQKFSCENKVAGYSVVDILIWQTDHFKAFLDRGDDINRYNECEMILKAFDTFMKLKAEPEKYLRFLTEESGSDYDGKF